MCIFQSFWSNCFQRVKQGWSRKWQPTPVFLPGESHGQRSLAGYSPCGHREPDTAERLTATTKQGDVNRYTSTLTLWIQRRGRTELQILENLEKLLSPKSPNVFFSCGVCTDSFCDSEARVLMLCSVGLIFMSLPSPLFYFRKDLLSSPTCVGGLREVSTEVTGVALVWMLSTQGLGGNI